MIFINIITSSTSYTSPYTCCNGRIWFHQWDQSSLIDSSALHFRFRIGPVGTVHRIWKPQPMETAPLFAPHTQTRLCHFHCFLAHNGSDNSFLTFRKQRRAWCTMEAMTSMLPLNVCKLKIQKIVKETFRLNKQNGYENVDSCT